jgi:putative nucleotidyltransferase with HDIG domain
MPAQRDRNLTPGGETAAAVARRLGEAVSSGANGNGNGHGRRNGNGAIETPSAREIAIDVCSAILAEASVGTAEHSSDVVLITEAIGERMGIAGSERDDLLAGARLHDIGKVSIPSRILEKPGPLTDEEWELMHQHTVVGEEILSSVAELEEVGRLVRHSHERWDGGGYPDGIAGSDIPIGSRIIFCADAFHAIRCDRPYRAGRSAREALAEIRRCAGTQFDPHVTAALEQVVRQRSRRPRAMGGSSRLFALLMCLVIGGAGTAIARSDLLAGSSGPAQSSSAPTPSMRSAAIAPTGPAARPARPWPRSGAAPGRSSTPMSPPPSNRSFASDLGGRGEWAALRVSSPCSCAW